MGAARGQRRRSKSSLWFFRSRAVVGGCVLAIVLGSTFLVLPISAWFQVAGCPLPAVKEIAARGIVWRSASDASKIIDVLLSVPVSSRGVGVARMVLDRVDPDRTGRASALADAIAGPERMRSEAALRLLRELDPDLAIVLPVLVERARSTRVRVEVVDAIGSLGADAAPAIPELVLLLEVGPGLTRRAAATALGQLGEAASPALPALVAALDDPDERVVGRVVSALRRLGPVARPVAQEMLVYVTAGGCEGPARTLLPVVAVAAPELAGPAILELLASEEARCRGLGAWALWRADGPGVAGVASRLVELLDDPDAYTRGKAALALVVQDPEQAQSYLPAIVALLTDSDEMTRMNAINAFALLGETAVDAVPGLVEVLEGRREAEVQLAARALGKVGGPAAFESLVAVLEGGRWNHEPHVGSFLVGALGLLGADAEPALPLLTEIVAASTGPRSDTMDRYRRIERRFYAADAITRIRGDACDRRCARALAWGLWSHASHDTNRQFAAAQAFERLGRASWSTRMQMAWHREAHFREDVRAAMSAALEVTGSH